MTTITDPNAQQSENTNNLRAIFEILAYLHVDAEKDGHTDLADRLEFAMNYAEKKLTSLKTAQVVPPVSADNSQS